MAILLFVSPKPFGAVILRHCVGTFTSTSILISVSPKPLVLGAYSPCGIPLRFMGQLF